MKIRALLKSYRIDSESEALFGAVSKFSMFVQEKSDPTDVCMVLESQVEHVIRKTREEFFSHTVSQLQENLKASAWYQVTYELQASEGGIQSFPCVVPDVIMRTLADASQSACDAVAPSRNSFTQWLGALLLDRTPAGGNGPSSADPKDEARLLNNLLKMIYDWIDCNREFLFVKELQEVIIYRNIMREACVKFTGRLNQEAASTGTLADMSPTAKQHVLEIPYVAHMVEKILPRKLSRFTSNGGDEEVFTIIRRYEDIFTVILTEWSGVHTIQCQLKTDCMDEWFLQLMVTGCRWALERLKDIVVYPSFREVLALVFKRQLSQL
ncbi:hypothetical protein MRX96_016670 [Rhipicephalus microplus]